VFELRHHNTGVLTGGIFARGVNIAQVIIVKLSFNKGRVGNKKLVTSD